MSNRRLAARSRLLIAVKCATYNACKSKKQAYVNQTNGKKQARSCVLCSGKIVKMNILAPTLITIHSGPNRIFTTSRALYLGYKDVITKRVVCPIAWWWPTSNSEPPTMEFLKAKLWTERWICIYANWICRQKASVGHFAGAIFKYAYKPKLMFSVSGAIWTVRHILDIRRSSSIFKCWNKRKIYFDNCFITCKTAISFQLFEQMENHPSWMRTTIFMCRRLAAFWLVSTVARRSVYPWRLVRGALYHA